jgi:hypothetical protein
MGLFLAIAKLLLGWNIFSNMWRHKGVPKELKHAASSILPGVGEFPQWFIPGAAKILRQLTDALHSGKVTFQWTPHMESAFQQAKQAICKATCLIHLDPTASICLDVDASDSHVGKSFNYRLHMDSSQLTFFSAKLSTAEQKYSALDRGLLAA